MWIDAICIDQSNLKERSFQVKQMRKIYHQAIRTVIWLGDESLDSKIAFKSLHKIPVLEEPFEDLWEVLSTRDDRHRAHRQCAIKLSYLLIDDLLRIDLLLPLIAGVLSRP
jgi:hypothetical protein